MNKRVGWVEAQQGRTNCYAILISPSFSWHVIGAIDLNLQISWVNFILSYVEIIYYIKSFSYNRRNVCVCVCLFKLFYLVYSCKMILYQDQCLLILEPITLFELLFGLYSIAHKFNTF